MNKRALSMALFAPVMLLLLSACGTEFMADRATNPVITTYLMQGATKDKDFHVVGLMSSNAGRRVVLIGKEGKFCAEPPPDVAEAYANAIALEAQAKATVPIPGGGPTVGGEGSAKLNREFATAAAPLMYRTQGLQMYRDGSFRLCNDFANGAINATEYKTLHAELLAFASALMWTEIPFISATASPSLHVATKDTKVTSDKAASASDGKTAVEGLAAAKAAVLKAASQANDAVKDATSAEKPK